MTKSRSHSPEPGSIIVGSGVYIPDGQNQNVLVVSDAGIMKSFAYIGPNIMQADKSFFVIDYNGGHYRTYGKFLSSRGYTVKQVNTINPGAGDHYNPLSYVESEKDIDALAEVIREYTGGKETPGNYDGQKDLDIYLLKALMAYFKWHAFPQSPSFYSILTTLYHGKSPAEILSRLDGFFMKSKNTSPDSYAVKNYIAFRNNREEECFLAITGCAVRMQAFNHNGLADMMAKDDIGLNRFGKEKTAIFIAFSPRLPDRYNLLAAIAGMQCMDAVARNRDTEGRVNTMLFFDRPLSTARIPGFMERIEALKDSSASVSLFASNIFSMKRYYGMDWDRLISCFGTALFLPGGVMHEEDIMNSFSSNRDGLDDSNKEMKGLWPLPVKHSRDTGAASLQDIMSDDGCIIVERGKPAYRAPKYRADSHPAWEQIK